MFRRSNSTSTYAAARRARAGSLKYIWSERLAKAFEFDKQREAVNVLESGAPINRDHWVKERVDVASDYRRRFSIDHLLNLGRYAVRQYDECCRRGLCGL